MRIKAFLSALSLFIFFLLAIVSESSLLTSRWSIAEPTNLNENHIVLNNSFLGLIFRNSACFSLIEMHNNLTGENYYFTGQPLYIIYVYREGRILQLSSCDVQGYNIRITKNNDAIKLSYNGYMFQVNGERYNVNLSFTITLPYNSKESYWALHLTWGAGIHIYKIMFPVIGDLIPFSKSFDEMKLLYPAWGGAMIISNPSKLCCPGEDQFPYPMNDWMQFIGVYGKGGEGGFYIYTNDSQGYYKVFHWEGGHRPWTSVIHYPPFITNLESYALPYNIILGVTNASDWKQLIEPYKQFVLKQEWYSQSEKKSWLDKVGIIMYNTLYVKTKNNGVKGSCRYEDLAEAASTLRKRLFLYNGTILLMINGWEREGQGYDYPNVFPPSEGWDSLKNLVIKLHELDYKVGYMILGSWLKITSNTTKLANEGLVPYDIYGKPYTVDVDYFYINPVCQYWRKNLIDIGSLLINRTGADALYYDTWFNGPINYYGNQSCPRGGGNYIVESYKNIIIKTREHTRRVRPNLLIMVEQLSEPLLPYINASYSHAGISKDIPPTWLQRIGNHVETIDLLNYLYGPRKTLLGILGVPLREQIRYTVYNGGEYYRRALIDELSGYIFAARTFLHGSPVPLGRYFVGAFTNESINMLHEKKLRFYEELAYARTNYLKKFLIDGMPLRFYEEGPTFTMHCPRSAITVSNCSYPIVFSAIQAAEWRSNDNETAVMMINVWNRPVDITLNETYNLVLLNGLPIRVTNKTLSIEPGDLLVLIRAPYGLKKDDLESIRDSVISHTRAFLLWTRFSKLDCNGLNALYKEELNLKYHNIKAFLQELINYSARLRGLYHKTYKKGYINSDPLLIEVKFTPFFYSFGAINFNNAIVSNVIEGPIFTAGNGYSYVSQIPMLIGYPHWDRSMEVRGYHVVIFPSYTYNGSYNEYNSFRTVIQLAFKNGTQYLNLSLTAGLWWKNKGWLNVTIKDVLTNKTVFRAYKKGGGWNNYCIPTTEIVLPKPGENASTNKTTTSYTTTTIPTPTPTITAVPTTTTYPEKTTTTSSTLPTTTTTSTPAEVSTTTPITASTTTPSPITTLNRTPTTSQLTSPTTPHHTRTSIAPYIPAYIIMIAIGVATIVLIVTGISMFLKKK